MKPISKLPYQVGNFNQYAVFTCEENGPKEVAQAVLMGDAKFIVHACNSYHGMIEAMNAALAAASNANAQLFDLACGDDVENAVRDAKEASTLLLHLQRDLRQAIVALTK